MPKANISVAQKLTYLATLTVDRSVVGAEKDLIRLCGELHAFMDKHGLEGKTNIFGEFTSETSTLKISLIGNTGLVGSPLSNARKFEIVRRFFQNNGFRSTVVLDEARIEDPEPDKHIKAEAEDTRDQPIDELAISPTAKALLVKFGLDTVGEIQSISAADAAGGTDTTIGLALALKDELAELDIYFKDDLRCAAQRNKIAREIRRARKVSYGPFTQVELIEDTELPRHTCQRLRNFGVVTLGCLLQCTAEELETSEFVSETDISLIKACLADRNLGLYLGE